ncbi:MAG: response regulator, partial [Flammeovirgaceae bacterium]|nr:response regulator [Flammeovirgaceae bacterium]MDW8287784.1 response regulator [Flammeovirgaceae bacterium]
MNCLIVDDEEAQRMMMRNFISRIKLPKLEIIKEFDNPQDTLSFLKENSGDIPIDIIFLDHHMEKMTGLQLVEELKKQKIFPQIILITTEKVLGTDAFDYDLTDYIVKPVDYDRFYRAIIRAQNKTSQDFMVSKNETSLYVKSDNKIIQVQIKSIYYIEALS